MGQVLHFNPDRCVKHTHTHTTRTPYSRSHRWFAKKNTVRKNACDGCNVLFEYPLNCEDAGPRQNRCISMFAGVHILFGDNPHLSRIATCVWKEKPRGNHPFGGFPCTCLLKHVLPNPGSHLVQSLGLSHRKTLTTGVSHSITYSNGPYRNHAFFHSFGSLARGPKAPLGLSHICNQPCNPSGTPSSSAPFPLSHLE